MCNNDSNNQISSSKIIQISTETSSEPPLNSPHVWPTEKLAPPSIPFCWVLRNSKKMCHSNLYFFISLPFFYTNQDWHASFNFSFCNLFSLVGILFRAKRERVRARAKDFLISENSHFKDYNTPLEKLQESRNLHPPRALSWVNRKVFSSLWKESRRIHGPGAEVKKRNCWEVSEWVWRERRKRKFPMWIKHVVAQPVSMW